MIRSDDLIALFQLMYAEHWDYEWGAARRGCVDCSGAFVYAFLQLGGSIYHGSNTIARKYVGAFQKTPAPGYAAFKWKKQDTSKYPDGRGDFYHIGLVDADGEHVLNAKGTKYGFCRDKADGWYCFAPLRGVSYDGHEDSAGGGGGVIYEAVVTTSGGRLNIRCGPGVYYRSIGSYKNGEKIDVHAEYDVDGDGKPDWAFIAGDGLTGYVSMAYLTPIDRPGSAQDAPQEPEGETPAEPPAEDPGPQPAARWGVWIACDNEEEARRYAGDIKGAVIVRME